MLAKRRLGLDIGTNSIGWCLLDLDDNGDPKSIFRAGARIFNDGRDPKSLTSLKANRRVARSARRRRDRFIQRQSFLINELVRCGLMPEDEHERRTLALKDPWQIRKTALDKEMSPYDVGRAFFHLNQRRGFKSNRKSQDNEAGVVKQSIAELEMRLSETGARTLGEFLADRHASGEPVRARRLGSQTSALYDLYPDRYMLEKEFDAIWSSQAAFNPSLFNDEAKDAVKDIIFYQRKLKPQEVGRCTLIPEETRVSKSLPSFQRFRIYQELANLSWLDREGKAHPIRSSLPARDALFNELEAKKKVTFKGMRRILKKMNIFDFDASFNLESDIRQHLDGDMTSCLMRSDDLLGSAWDSMSEDDQDALILMLNDDQMDDEEVEARLSSGHCLTKEQIEACLDVRLPDGHGALSKAAIDKILPILRDQGLDYYEAVREAGFGEANLYDPNAPLSDRLDYYGKALSGHVMGASGKPEDRDETRYGSISNPSVHIALNQIRQVVNEIIRLHGKPDEIVLEIGRDLPMGADGKRELQKLQKRNQDNNEEARAALSKHGVIDSRQNRQKFQLWEQLASDPTDRLCPFTGRMISLSELFSDKVEVEHLLPFSSTLDDSMSNKVVCYREANRIKGKKSPFEAFGSSPEGYDWEEIIERSSRLPSGKRWRFLPNAMQIHEEEGGFMERHLNDMRYISRYTSQYLATIIPSKQIWVVTGRLTAMLRGFWGLNSVLRGHNEDAEGPSRKMRDDHRHHAVDAVVIAMTSRGLIQRISKSARRSEIDSIDHLFHDRIDPWKGFRDEVKKTIDGIIVSHRPRKKHQGQLHNDTAYGIVEHNENGPSLVVRRKAIEAFSSLNHVSEIRDPLIKSALEEELQGLSGKGFQDAITSWCDKRGIKSLRVLETVSVIPIEDKNGSVYKGYKGDGNAYMDIYEEPDTGEWKSEIVSRFDAQPSKRFTPSWQREYPTARLVMRLRKNDLLQLRSEERTNVYYVQKLSGGRITLAPHFEANVDARDRSNEDPFSFLNKAASSLQASDAKRVHISATGLLSEG